MCIRRALETNMVEYITNMAQSIQNVPTINIIFCIELVYNSLQVCNTKLCGTTYVQCTKFKNTRTHTQLHPTISIRA